MLHLSFRLRCFVMGSYPPVGYVIEVRMRSIQFGIRLVSLCCLTIVIVISVRPGRSLRGVPCRPAHSFFRVWSLLVAGTVSQLIREMKSRADVRIRVVYSIQGQGFRAFDLRLQG